ncbi:MAG: hypothetical protein K8R60_13440 [Burkholderiales bacterium]|nr:hypothetical protein [Burkholderiales bacterium]
MIVFRWILGVLGAFFAIGATVGFVLFIAFDSKIWLDRARRFRHWVWLIGLFWFNVEVWGRVAWTIWHWGK